MAAISWIKGKKNNHTQTKTRIQNCTTGSWNEKTYILFVIIFCEIYL